MSPGIFIQNFYQTQLQAHQLTADLQQDLQELALHDQQTVSTQVRLLEYLDLAGVTVNSAHLAHNLAVIHQRLGFFVQIQLQELQQHSEQLATLSQEFTKLRNSVVDLTHLLIPTSSPTSFCTTLQQTLKAIQTEVQTLHQEALIVFRDNRWLGDQAILATMEIDLSRGSQLVYIFPDAYALIAKL